ncbi:hypothetical protein [Candidatus Magnetominusculus xianensis]|uniref:hypothetical protein n=1 Tax=Candidatus Magnetominusculus xianensis TaxID=1748249 RepID=UPI0012EE9826|nr:hypothetical protein [Candidatus Magnetominusculus xianensis]
MEQNPEPKEAVADQPEATDRREAILKMGRYAAYTAPVILTLLAAKDAQSAPAS